MAGERRGKVTSVTGAASGIGWASAEATIADGVHAVMIDRGRRALAGLDEEHGEAAVPQ